VKRASSSLRFVAMTVAALAVLALPACKKKPPVETNLVAILASVSVNPTTIQGGSSVQGTVTLDATATSAMTVALSTSAPASVPGTVTVPNGGSSATFTVTTTAVASNTSPTISASLNGVSRSTTLLVTAPPVGAPTLVSLSLSAVSVTGGTNVQGTVTLSGPATGATAVGLASNDNAAATVPANVTVNSGATSANFTITTLTVGTPTAVTITASLAGTNRAGTLTVNPPAPVAPVANFTVTSLSAAFRRRDGTPGNTPADPAPVQILPAGTADACPLINNNGNQKLDCEFDGSGSMASANIDEYIWTYSFGTQQKTENSGTNPRFRPTPTGCGFFGGQGNGTQGGGLTFIGMKVDLQVKSAGTLSAVKSSQNIRIFPAGQCGYGF